MKSVLVGNGFNIQFGGKAYTSEFIIERMKFRAGTNQYDALFEESISGQELMQLFNCFVDLTNKILLGEYDDIIDDQEQKRHY